MFLSCTYIKPKKYLKMRYMNYYNNKKIEKQLLFFWLFSQICPKIQHIDLQPFFITTYCEKKFKKITNLLLSETQQDSDSSPSGIPIKSKACILHKETSFPFLLPVCLHLLYIANSYSLPRYFSPINKMPENKISHAEIKPPISKHNP